MRKIILIATLFISACSFNAAGVIADDSAVDAGILADGAAAPDGCADADVPTPDAPAPDAASPDADPTDAAQPVPTITCKVVSAGIEYTITGGIMHNLYGGTVAHPSVIEYCDNADGWCPDQAGTSKTQVAYGADNGAYTLTLSTVNDDLNFFLADPTDTDASDGVVGGKYFDLSKWTIANAANGSGVTPNCRLDSHGGGIIH